MQTHILNTLQRHKRGERWYKYETGLPVLNKECEVNLKEIIATTTVAQFPNFLYEEWDQKKQKTELFIIHHLVSPMPECLLIVVRRNGIITKLLTLYCPAVLQVWYAI